MLICLPLIGFGQRISGDKYVGEYPAFVYHYTDFSPSRADVLKKDLKVSNSKKQIEEIFNDEILKNIKKGWEKV